MMFSIFHFRRTDRHYRTLQINRSLSRPEEQSKAPSKVLDTEIFLFHQPCNLGIHRYCCEHASLLDQSYPKWRIQQTSDQIC
uniref:Uncharacterized protein n=1 Tax=Aedes aegypti TaxID=7159 RepID=Q1HRE8_AEDAE|nr:hypothetical protein [Aedes aegypti]